MHALGSSAQPRAWPAVVSLPNSLLALGGPTVFEHSSRLAVPRKKRGGRAGAAVVSTKLEGTPFAHSIIRLDAKSAGKVYLPPTAVDGKSH